MTAVNRWLAYRVCPVCKAATGDACTALSGLTAAGKTYVAAELDHAHIARKLRKERRA